MGDITYFLTVFWMIGILWAMYYWHGSSSRNEADNMPKLVLEPDRRHSTSSIESLEHSDNECTRSRQKNMQKPIHEIKTRWPSETSLQRRSYKSF